MGPELMAKLRAQAEHVGTEIVSDIVASVDLSKRPFVAVTDGGTVLNPSQFDQQIQGGVAQGIGYALMEDMERREGKVLNRDLATYLVPTAPDLPDIHSCRLEANEATGPFGLKGVGEVAMNGPLPAVANGLDDACGVRLGQAPLTPERVLLALEEQRWR